MFGALSKLNKSPMASSTWKKGIRKKDLKGVLDLLKEEGQLMHPKHQRRMKVLREKKGQRWARLWSRDWDWDQSGLKAGLKLWDHLPKVSVSVSKFETDFKSISISLKFWDHNPKVSVSVSKCNGWSRSSQILRPSEKVNFTSSFHKFLC